MSQREKIKNILNSLLNFTNLPVFIGFIAVIIGVFILGSFNFLLAHVVVELFSIIIAFLMFLLVWANIEKTDNNFLIFLGIAYFFIGGIDLIHTLTYEGMGIFVSLTSNHPTQLWIIARYMEAGSFLLAIIVIGKKNVKSNYIFAAYSVISIFLLLTVFYWGVFPDSYIPGYGLTRFKIVSEYLISGVLAISLLFLHSRKEHFKNDIYHMISISIVLTIFAEISFTQYVSVYGLANLIGHIFKLFSFYFIYKSIVLTSIKRPYDTIFRNLQKRKEELENSKARIEELLDGVNDPILVHDLEGNFIMVNEAAVDRYGYSREEFMDMKPYALDYEKNETLIKRRLEKINRKGYLTFEEEHETKDGRKIPVEINSRLIDFKGDKAVVSVARDITERKEREEDIKKSKRFLEATIDSLSANIAILDEEGYIIEVNEGWKKFAESEGLGWENYGVGENYIKVTEKAEGESTEGVSEIEKGLKEVIRGERDEFKKEYPCHSPEEKRWFLMIASRFEVEGKTRVALSHMNITERKLAENKLKESKDRLDRAEKVAKIGSWELDLETEELIWSDETYRIFEVPTNKEIKYEDFLEKVHPDDKEYVDKEWNRALEEGEYDIEHRILVDGKTKWVREKAEIEYDEERDPTKVTGSVQDITERKRREKREKLTSNMLEILNKPIEHVDQIKNILTIIQDFTDIEAIGIRVKDGEDYTYYETNGFTSEFVKAENSLCITGEDGEILRDENGEPVLTCLCGAVIRGNTDPDLSFYTEKGSFWTNNAQKFVEETSEEILPEHVNGRCPEEGYKSMALVPLRSNEKTLGLLQLNDKREGMLDEEKIKFFEEIGSSIGIAIQRKKEKEELIKKDLAISTSIEGMAFTDLEGNLDFVNDAFLDIFGYEDEDLVIKKHAKEFIKDNNKADEVIREVKTEGWWKGELTGIKKNDEEIKLNSSVNIIKDEKGNTVGMLTSIEDITEQKEREEAFTTILKSISGNTGMELFDNIVKTLRDWLEVGYIFIGERKGNSIETLSMLKEGEIDREFEYSLPNTPCDRVTEEGMCVYESNVAELFPEDEDLEKLGAEGYVGIPLKDDQGKSIGVMWAVSKEELDLPDRTEEVFEILSRRASSELLRLKAEKEIRDAKQRWEETFNAMTDGISIHDENFEIVQANEAFEEYFPKEDLDKKCYELIHETDEPIEKCPAKKCSQTGEDQTAEIYEPTLDKYLSVRCDPIIGYEGEVKEVVHIIRDITDRREREEELRKTKGRLENLINSSPLAIISTDKKGIVGRWNPAAEDVFGWDREEVLGRQFPMLKGNEKEFDHEEVKELFERAIEGEETRRVELQLSTKEEDKIYTSISTSPLRGIDGDVIGVLAIIDDITEEKEVERKAEEARELLEEREVLLHRLGHDLKTPLTPLKNLLPILEDRFSGVEEDEIAEMKVSHVQRMVETCERNAQYIDDIVKHILNLTEYSGKSGELLNKTVDLSKLTHEFVNDFQDRNQFEIHEKNVEISTEIEDEVYIKGDSDSLKEVYDNLLSNSLEHVDHGGEIIIKIKEDIDKVEISVSDDGKGMKEEELDHLFEEFYKGDKSRTQKDSKGLGLSISKKIIEMHNGEIWAESPGPGEGSTIYFELPKI